MTLVASWLLFLLGIAHVLFGMARYRPHFQEAFSEGFVGRFSGEYGRALAFWFTIMGLPLALIGFLAAHLVSIGDLGTVKIIGFALLMTAVTGVLAFPKSPLWLLVLLSPIFVLGGYEVIS
ncbi:DUF6463 family protein (plasmid) [Deinococcus taeanensis]|uniref:DUF6463 family protein n=1 Tax=Deinococcus taeanensis TaxID=2737050 RepID=UPI001CDCFF4E|nr:DUF6463 family protein [Deinococcus taeanensis]UBV44490.1 DUF6463 family protein [Deinococcus taeanensis]